MRVFTGFADEIPSFLTMASAERANIRRPVSPAPLAVSCVTGGRDSEEIVGKALEGVRAEAVIATKTGLEWRDGKVYPGTHGRILHDIL
jgi:hypothetical protein